MDSEIKEVVYIAISAILLSLVLGFIAVVGVVQRDIAQARNDTIVGNINMGQHRKYSKYDKKEITGEEVIECIRMYYDSGIDIYVASDDIEQNKFNLEEYMKSGNREYFIVREGGKLLSWFSHDKKYRAYLVYNSENLEDKYNRMMNKYEMSNAYVSGSMQERYKEMDEIDGYKSRSFEVTGILIIDINRLL